MRVLDGNTTKRFDVFVDFEADFTACEVDTAPSTLEELGIGNWRSTVIHGETICHYLENPEVVAAITTPEDDGTYSWRAFPTPKSEAWGHLLDSREEAPS